MGRLHWPCPLWVPWEPWEQPCAVGFGGWPKAHGPLGGKYTLERRRWGSGVYSPLAPLGSPPQMAPLILGVSLVIRHRFLPIFRTFLGDLVGILVIRRVLLHPLDAD